MADWESDIALLQSLTSPAAPAYPEGGAAPSGRSPEYVPIWERPQAISGIEAPGPAPTINDFEGDASYPDVRQQAISSLRHRDMAAPQMDYSIPYSEKALSDSVRSELYPQVNRLVEGTQFRAEGGPVFPSARSYEDDIAALQQFSDQRAAQPAPAQSHPVMRPEPRPVGEWASQTWPAQLGRDVWSAVTLPRDVLTGAVPHAELYDPSPATQERALGLAALPMVATTGAPAGALGAGPAGLGALAQRTESAAPIRAYHGSPHDFDRFSLGAMGTGEGAQIYGPGLYFAENPTVAQHYRDQLGRPLYGGRPFDPTDASHRVAERVALFADQPPEQTMRELRRLHAQDLIDHRRIRDEGGSSWLLKPEQISRMLADSRVARSGRIPEITQGGRMYEVDVHARPDQILHFDRGILAQPQAVQEYAQTIPAIQKKMADDAEHADFLRYVLDRGLNGNVTEATRKDQLRRLASVENGPPAEMLIRNMRQTMRPDEYLGTMRDMGVTATRYLDAGSRGRSPTDPRASHNLVVHDDRIIDILRKYGLAGAAATGTAASAMDHNPAQ